MVRFQELRRGMYYRDPEEGDELVVYLGEDGTENDEVQPVYGFANGLMLYWYEPHELARLIPTGEFENADSSDDEEGKEDDQAEDDQAEDDQYEDNQYEDDSSSSSPD